MVVVEKEAVMVVVGMEGVMVEEVWVVEMVVAEKEGEKVEEV